MLFSAIALAALSAASMSCAAPTPESAAGHELEARATSSACPQYVLINTRGTGEPQGQSAGFRTMNSQITAALSGGTIYNTVYTADFSQNSAAGTADIIRRINSGLASNPNVCYILQGYSQGAAATVVALQQLGTSGAAFNAVKGVFLIGNPDHKAGLTCNVDSNGGTTTRNVNGLSVAYQGSIPSGWVSKTLDVCAYGDGVCDTTHGYGINAPHLSYPNDQGVQSMGYKFAVNKLGGSA
uniref:Cutinase-like enzyme n=1 Tax=Saitozyma flava TaxID=5416 RepID=A0A0P0ZE81_SAIFL|nr:cutinase-like enzyme [Saitozyma flava]